MTDGMTCHAPVPCPTPDLCGNLEECCWPKPSPDYEGVRTVMVPVAIEMLRFLSRDWSEPVRIKIVTDEYGKHTMVLRTVEADQ